ncbi:MAG TPA: hypothetical protein VKB18_03265 [Gemmatimonadota bacterium]|nr:hypothetical protein [Gemmatimonadota bacterium]
MTDSYSLIPSRWWRSTRPGSAPTRSYYETSPLNGGRSPRDGKRFLNARAEAYWELRELLEAGEIALPRDEKLFDELVAIRWKPTGQGKIQIESKDDLRGRLGRSPDRAAAVSMAFYSRSVRGRGLRHLEPVRMG